MLDSRIVFREKSCLRGASLESPDLLTTVSKFPSKMIINPIKYFPSK